MPSSRVWMIALPLAAVWAASAPADPPRTGFVNDVKQLAADAKAQPLDAKALAARIDQRIDAGWKAAKLKQVPLADDAEFLRRVYLDLAGRIPSVTEARRFLDDKAADKREKLVDELLKSPRY